MILKPKEIAVPIKLFRLILLFSFVIYYYIAKHIIMSFVNVYVRQQIEI